MPQRSRRPKASGTRIRRAGRADCLSASKKQTPESVWYSARAQAAADTASASKKQTPESVWYAGALRILTVVSRIGLKEADARKRLVRSRAPSNETSHAEPQRSRRPKASGTGGLSAYRRDSAAPQRSRRPKASGTWALAGVAGAVLVASKKQTPESVWYLSVIGMLFMLRSASKKQTPESVWYPLCANGRSLPQPRLKEADARKRLVPARSARSRWIVFTLPQRSRRPKASGTEPGRIVTEVKTMPQRSRRPKASGTSRRAAKPPGLCQASKKQTPESVWYRLAWTDVDAVIPPQRSRRPKASGTRHAGHGEVRAVRASKKQTPESVWYL